MRSQPQNEGAGGCTRCGGAQLCVFPCETGAASLLAMTSNCMQTLAPPPPSPLNQQTAAQTRLPPIIVAIACGTAFSATRLPSPAKRMPSTAAKTPGRRRPQHGWQQQQHSALNHARAAWPPHAASVTPSSAPAFLRTLRPISFSCRRNLGLRLRRRWHWHAQQQWKALRAPACNNKKARGGNCTSMKEALACRGCWLQGGGGGGAVRRVAAREGCARLLGGGDEEVNVCRHHLRRDDGLCALVKGGGGHAHAPRLIAF